MDASTFALARLNEQRARDLAHEISVRRSQSEHRAAEMDAAGPAPTGRSAAPAPDGTAPAPGRDDVALAGPAA